MTKKSEQRRTYVSPALVFEQMPMLMTLARLMARSILPKRTVSQCSESFVPARTVIAAPSDKLVSCYANWSGAGQRYANVLPPHMFSHWALPLATRVIEQTGCDLASIVNYGVTMKINGEIPRGVPLHLVVSIKSFKKSETLARATVEIVSGTKEQSDAIVATLHILFIQPSRRKDATRSTTKAEPQWSTAGHWCATPDDGFNFALLTGDFNPIHWKESAGRKSPFGHTVLQGMGMFARSFECLADAGPVREIDVRFLKPVQIPSPDLGVQHTTEDHEGWRMTRLTSDGKQVHMAGRYR